MAYRNGFGTMAAYNVEKSFREVSANFEFDELDLNNVVISTSGAAITGTIPLDLPLGWSASLVQNGTGKVTLAGEVGVTIRNSSAGLRTIARGAKVDILVIGVNEILVSSADLEAVV